MLSRILDSKLIKFMYGKFPCGNGKELFWSSFKAVYLLLTIPFLIFFFWLQLISFSFFEEDFEIGLVKKVVFHLSAVIISLAQYMLIYMAIADR